MSSSSGREAVERRPIAPSDKDALARGFERLGEESRYRRFLSPHGRLTAAELRYFTEVDHHEHEALAAIDRHTGEEIVGRVRELLRGLASRELKPLAGHRAR